MIPAFGQGGTPPGKRSEGLKNKVAEILSSSVGEDVTKRRTAVERLVALGAEAVPAIGEGLTRGNHHAARTAAIALGEIADEAAGMQLVKYFTGHRHPGDETDIATVAAYALGACAGKASTDTLIVLAENDQDDLLVRAAAALGLARRSDRPASRISAAFTKFTKRPDADPEVFGGLVLAVARNDASLVASKVPGLLKDMTDPAARAACWLALAYIKKPGPRAAGESDIESSDPFLARFALMGVGEPPRKGENGPEELREARIVSLAFGAGDVSLASLATAESSEDLRRVWNGAFAERGWTAQIVTSPWKEKEIGENGRFAAAALLALQNKFSAEEKTALGVEARERWNGNVTTATGAALLLAALGDRDAEGLLAPDNPTPEGKRPPAARLAWKRLRGELDQRRFEQAVLSFANAERVLAAGWMADATRAYVAATLGQGSHFFLNQKKYPMTSKTLLPQGTSRRKRSIPAEHPMYSDLWYQILGTPADAMLMFPRDENG
jgi:hypothetical protein